MAGVSSVIEKRSGLVKRLSRDIRIFTILGGPHPHLVSADALEVDNPGLLGCGIAVTGFLGWLSARADVRVLWSVKAFD